MRTLSLLLMTLLSVNRASAAELGIKDTVFTIDGKPTFLLGVSYYAALGASEETVRRDLGEMKRLGFNWVRIWATWAAFDNNVSAVTRDGEPRPEYLKKLQWFVAECDKIGFVVDVSLSRGNGVSGPERLQTYEAHRKAVDLIVDAIKERRNWYLDLSNERNIKDKRFTSFEDLRRLRTAVREMYAKRLVTASHAGDMSQDDVKQYLQTVKVDSCPPIGRATRSHRHRPRQRRVSCSRGRRTLAVLSRYIIRSHSAVVSASGSRKPTTT